MHSPSIQCCVNYEDRVGRGNCSKSLWEVYIDFVATVLTTILWDPRRCSHGTESRSIQSLQ